MSSCLRDRICWYATFKRVADICVSAALLVLLTPLMVLIWIAVVTRLGRPAIFAQTRPGLHGRPFRILKFRTMTNARGADGSLLPDALRLTRLGAFLRAASLDELPELVNVLKGDMSLVGPRPLLPEYMPLYNQHQARRHEVRPGITGLAQVSGRNAVDWERKFDLDVHYVDHMSLLMDLRILFLTIRSVLVAEGINAQGHATMPPFTGTGMPGGS